MAPRTHASGADACGAKVKLPLSAAARTASLTPYPPAGVVVDGSSADPGAAAGAPGGSVTVTTVGGEQLPAASSVKYKGHAHVVPLAADT